MSATARRKPLRHERHNAEVSGMFAHYGWAIFSLAQGLLSIAYAWMSFAFVRLTASPAAECLFWLCISSAVFGLGGAIWHWYAGNEHRKAARRGR